MAAEQGMRVVCALPGTGLDRVMRAFLLLLWFAARGNALYFHIGETEKKCFIEEIPDETMVIGARTKGRVWGEPLVLGRGLRDSQLSGARRSWPCRPWSSDLGSPIVSRKLPDAAI
jgi:hypothetical protein